MDIKKESEDEGAAQTGTANATSATTASGIVKLTLYKGLDFPDGNVYICAGDVTRNGGVGFLVYDGILTSKVPIWRSLKKLPLPKPEEADPSFVVEGLTICQPIVLHQRTTWEIQIFLEFLFGLESLLDPHSKPVGH
ncbi:hypothetical protein V5O48_009434 [Marasmius crinis-equi]|uniref:Uncharacterized protein n=1 Tax=Marasmius crinis-equi TaxID=585013 RepID=A0ABR3FBB4_9AGAR